MRHGKPKPATQPAPAPRLIDLNTATVQEICTLPGISPRIAEAMTARRPIRSWDDLKEVPGMSQGLLKQLRNSGVRLGLATRLHSWVGGDIRVFGVPRHH